MNKHSAIFHQTMLSTNKVNDVERTMTLHVVVDTRPLTRDEGMVEDHGAQKAGQFPKIWIRGHRQTKSHQRVSSAESIAGQF